MYDVTVVVLNPAVSARHEVSLRQVRPSKVVSLGRVGSGSPRASRAAGEGVAVGFSMSMQKPSEPAADDTATSGELSVG